jgi:hypothetical protein
MLEFEHRRSRGVSTWHSLIVTLDQLKFMKTSNLAIAITMSVELFMATGSAAQAAQPASGVDISPGQKISYFMNADDAVPPEIRPFLRIPAGIPLPADTHLQICQDFAWWAAQILQPEYVPSDAFIIANLKLFPATDERKQDMAFLACRKGEMDYLIVQTGGVQGRLVIVSDRIQETGVRDETAAREAFVSGFARFAKSIADAPNFAVRKQDALYTCQVGYGDSTRGILLNAKGVTYDREIALSFWKWRGLVGAQAPAHEPAPDQWFQWEMGKLLKAPFPRP